MIRIYDTKLREKVDLVALEHGTIKMYVCGPTVYNYIHIGNARTFVSFDVIRKYLEWRGFKVIFVQNITDVDDKIINKANEEGMDAAEVARIYTDAFIEDMHALGIADPTVRPRATQEIPAMIKLVETLIETGHAYEADGDVYFDVRSLDDYGALSGRNVDEMESGHRELRAGDLEDRKRDPLDFAVWKAAKPGEPSWESPWGQGRPGWHLECSTMARKYLGLPFDIHGGGSDHVFPHHENERAQSEAAHGVTFANHWMHGGMLQINGEKMSKSLNNFFLLRDILEQVDPYDLRFLMLQSHYRSSLDFSEERVTEASTAFERIKNTLRSIDWAIANAAGETGVLDEAAVKDMVRTAKLTFIADMDDDFNTSKAIGGIFDYCAVVNSMLAGKTLSTHDAELAKALRDLLVELMGALGIDLEAAAAKADEGDSEYPAELFEAASSFAGYGGTNGEEALQALLDARAAARAEKNWGAADGIRDALTELGFTIMDTPQGARVERK